MGGQVYNVGHREHAGRRRGEGLADSRQCGGGEARRSVNFAFMRLSLSFGANHAGAR